MAWNILEMLGLGKKTKQEPKKKKAPIIKEKRKRKLLRRKNNERSFLSLGIKIKF